MATSSGAASYTTSGDTTASALPERSIGGGGSALATQGATSSPAAARVTDLCARAIALLLCMSAREPAGEACQYDSSGDRYNFLSPAQAEPLVGAPLRHGAQGRFRFSADVENGGLSTRGDEGGRAAEMRQRRTLRSRQEEDCRDRPVGESSCHLGMSSRGWSCSVTSRGAVNSLIYHRLLATGTSRQHQGAES